MSTTLRDRICLRAGSAAQTLGGAFRPAARRIAPTIAFIIIASSAEEAQRKLDELMPPIVLVELLLSGGLGARLIERLHQAGATVIACFAARSARGCFRAGLPDAFSAESETGARGDRGVSNAQA